MQKLIILALLASVAMSSTVFFGWNSPGNDFAGMPMIMPDGNAERCKEFCQAFTNCEAWVFSPPGCPGATAT